MKIRTIDVFSEREILYVEFSSPFGNGTAFLHGANPSVGLPSNQPK
ncbi:hypothetical protein C4J91_1962 [Pseudomonas sp. R3-52-08]|nr:hypothetical protein C4J91_1962 [Pseudomonas sp. R3-52-08]